MSCNFEDIVYTCEEKAEVETEYRNSTYTIVSTMAYLLGVEKRFFDETQFTLKPEYFTKLNNNKHARIIRNLCMIRTSIERNYKYIDKECKENLKNVTTLPQYVPSDAVSGLANDGLDIYMANVGPNDYIININKEIKNRINNCKNLFPVQINWTYLQELFLMPDGLSTNGIRKAAKNYYENMGSCPFGVYINWEYGNHGNILYNDLKFVNLLYESHEDRFYDISLLTDIGEATITSIDEFLEQAKRIEIIVDCENSDPFKLYSALQYFGKHKQIHKVQKMVLYDDVHTSAAWEIFDNLADITVEHKMIERVKESKSYLDVKLATETTQDHMTLSIDSFILVSSDSDYWGLIDSLKNARFMMMVEKKKTSDAIKEKLYSEHISYCYLDKFNSGDVEKIKHSAINKVVNEKLNEALFNIDEILNYAFEINRISMTEVEQKQYYDRYIKPMKLCISVDGDAYIQLGA